MRIERAADRHVPLILEMIRGLADYEKLLDHVTATEELLREHLFGSSPVAEVLLAFAGDECVGLALYFQSFSTFLAKPGLFLEDLFVKPEWRGEGAGTALLKRLAQIAHERGCGRLEWEVLDWNEPSIEFYESMGAVPMNDWTKYRLTGEALARLSVAEKC